MRALSSLVFKVCCFLSSLSLSLSLPHILQMTHSQVARANTDRGKTFVRIKYTENFPPQLIFLLLVMLT